MWKFNPFTKEPTGLEGRTIDVGTIKVTVRSPIAEGGFSCVYLARDAAQPSKQYALKHMICNDEESMENVMREIGVLRGLSGHPNVVRMVSHAVFDMGRTKEAMLVMEYCEKSLVGVLEGRGGEWFEEREVMVVFRDVCNAVQAMHEHSPPIAHRDLKAENILLGSDGAWKLCDFGSTSTNHKCFSKPEEMGLEEDNIRKHTTPAYRAPEMWDLYRREVISEKVDIWALGCLLYRICYLKSAFDGESKLQVLNGNYQIPDSPKYSASTIGLIKSMLQASPDARPNITQVCFRVNQQLPLELRMHVSDDSLLANGLHAPAAVSHEEAAKKTPTMPRGSSPSSSSAQIRKIPPPSEKEMQNSRPLQGSSHPAVGGGASFGGEGRVCSDKQNTLVCNQNSINSKPNPLSEHQVGAGYPPRQSVSVNSSTHANSFEVKFSKGSKHCSDSISRKVELEAEVNRLKEQLEKAVFEKTEITSKYENLSAICRSQHQALQELKRAHSSASSSHAINGNSRIQMPSASLQSSIPQRDKIGGLWELEQGMFVNSSSSANQDSKTWQAFPEESSTQPMPHALYNYHVGSVWTSNSRDNLTTQPAAAGHPNNGWSLGMDNLAWPSGVSPISTCIRSSTSQRSNGGEVKGVETGQPAGWAGF